MNTILKTGIFGLLVVSILVGAILCGCSSPAEPTPSQPTPTQATPSQTTPTLQPSPVGASWVEVVYFHRDQRCVSCRRIEEATRDTIDTYFADRLESGELAFQVSNVQDEANADIIERYGAYTSSLFVNTVKDGQDHIEEVTNAWLLVNDMEQLRDLIKGEIEEHLEEL